MLFKEFADVDAYALCVDSKDPQELIDICTAVAPAFGGINLEDISAPVCFEVEDRLKETLDIPVFHDDQHGTAIVVLAAFINALKLTGGTMAEQKVVVSGVGASGVACSKILMNAGVTNIIGCDTRGAIHKGRTENMNSMKHWYAEHTNPEGLQGSLDDVIEGATLFLGLSGPDTFKVDQLKRMAKDPIVFAMANPTPGDHARGRSALRADHGDGALGLPQPDQQRARLPRRVPRGPRLPRTADQRRHEGRRSDGHRQHDRRRRTARGVHHPERLQPLGRQDRRRRRDRAGTEGRPRPDRRARPVVNQSGIERPPRRPALNCNRPGGVAER